MRIKILDMPVYKDSRFIELISNLDKSAGYKIIYIGEFSKDELEAIKINLEEKIKNTKQ